MQFSIPAEKLTLSNPNLTMVNMMVSNNPTAAVLLIGNEILSGRTQDINLKHIAENLSAVGIRMCECRVIADIEEVIVDALNTLRKNYTYVFTTGGIGPTHDDITAQCVANAFGVPLLQHPQAVDLLTNYFNGRGVEPNEARMRMANVPKGGTLVDNPVSVAPGFCIDNVYVMAGVPRIMQAMFANIIPTLKHGSALLSVTVVCNLPEGQISHPLGLLQDDFPDLDLGSYPGKQDSTFRVSLVARGTDREQLGQVTGRLKDLVSALDGQVIDTKSDI